MSDIYENIYKNKLNQIQPKRQKFSYNNHVN